MAGTRRIEPDSPDGLPVVQPAARVRAMSRRRCLGVLGPAARARARARRPRGGARPPDAGGTVCTYRVAEAPPYDTPQGHIRVHYVADPADRDSPAPTSTRVGGVPDWIVAVGEAAEAAWARETALGFPPPPADDGDGAERGGDARYDVYVCDLASHDLGELAATVADPPGSGFSYIVVDNDYAPGRGRAAHDRGRRAAARDASRTSSSTRSRSARGAGGCRSGWPRRAPSGWRGSSPPRTSIARSTGWRSGGRAPRQPYWRGGDLHEYGAWWLIAQLEHAPPGFVRRLLALAAARGDDDPRRARAARARLWRPARARGGLRALRAHGARRSPGRQGAARAAHARLCAPAGGSCCGRGAAAQPAPLARADAAQHGPVRSRGARRRPRRGRAPRLARSARCARGAVRISGGQGALLRARRRRRERRRRTCGSRSPHAEFAAWVIQAPI